MCAHLIRSRMRQNETRLQVSKMDFPSCKMITKEVHCTCQNQDVILTGKGKKFIQRDIYKSGP